MFWWYVNEIRKETGDWLRDGGWGDIVRAF